LNKLGKIKCSGEEMNINELPDEKQGRKLMLGEELDKQVQSYLLNLHCNGAQLLILQLQLLWLKTLLQITTATCCLTIGGI